MTQENKNLLLKDLCARLPYGVKCTWFIECILTRNRVDYIGELIDICKVIKTNGYAYWDCYFHNSEDEDDYEYSEIPIEIVKPYLRPMSSMTEEEKKEFSIFIGKTETYRQQICLDSDSMCNPTIGGYKCVYWGLFDKCFDWLNAHHFDYRGLIEKGLAIEAP